jgi:cell division protein FtsZ
MGRGVKVGSEYIEDDDLEQEAQQLKILVIGCGGGGCNSINRLSSLGLRGAETVAINTDRRHLTNIKADKRLLIGAGVTRGFGAGGDPDLGRVCAENAWEPLNAIIHGTNLTFVLVGMGGGTGTGTAPVVAETARRYGSVVISIATTPFDFEKARKEHAARGIRRLESVSDTLMLLDNNRLLDMVPNLPIEQAFGVMDQLISEVVKGLIEAITEPSLINLDFADLKTIMSHGGISTVLYGENSDPESVVRDTLDNPLLDVDYKGATGALIHVTGGRNLTLKKATKVVEGMTESLDPDANVIFGARIDDDCEGLIRVMAVLTGISTVNDDVEEIDVADDMQDEIEEVAVTYTR